jgi:hypothetical protein
MESQEPSTIVRLLIFSGRPDPEWMLDDEARDQLSARVREALGKEESNPPPPAGLGYRGFLVRTARPVSQLPEFTVFRGVLTAGAGQRAAHWRDIAGVEELLLTQARERGYGDALDLFGAGSRGKSQDSATLAS